MDRQYTIHKYQHGKAVEARIDNKETTTMTVITAIPDVNIYVVVCILFTV